MNTAQRHERNRETEGHDYEIDRDRWVVVLELHGPVTLASLLDVANRIYGDATYDPSMACIIDLAAANLQMSFADMARYVLRIGAEPRRLRGTLVFITTTPMGYGMGKMYAALAHEFQNAPRFVATREEAFRSLESRHGRDDVD